MEIPATTFAPTASPHFASSSDYRVCRRLHREHGTSYYLATKLFPRTIRQRVHALYGFVRVPDEWVDRPGSSDPAHRLETWKQEFLDGMQGKAPSHPSMRAFCDVAGDFRMPVDEPLAFLDAMSMDLHRNRYATYEDLRTYMRGSAVSVGIMMCYITEAKITPELLKGASALAEAMQLTNFLRDVAEDAAMGRIYLPQEDLARFGVAEADIFKGRTGPAWNGLLQFQIARTDALYAEADQAIPLLPLSAQAPVRLARELYSRILRRIESQEFDVFSQRARTSRSEKLRVAAQVLWSRR